MNRPVGSSLVFGLVCSVLLSLPAAVGAAPFPRLVLPRTAEVQVVDEARRPQAIPVGLLLDVLRVDGGHYWVGRGWVAADQVIALDDAVAHFTAALKTEPTPFAYVSRARAQTQLGLQAEAEADCRAALALEPDYAPAHCQLGRALTMQKKTNAAVASLDRALELDPRSAIAHCCRAQARQASGDAASAAGDYDRAIELDPQLVVAYFQRSGIRAQRGDEPGAMDDLIEVLVRHPDHFLALNNRGNIWVARRQWSYAISDYTAALKVASRADVFMNRARALHAAGRPREALVDCNEALRLDPNSEQAYRRRAALLGELGRETEAGDDLQRADRLTSLGIGT